MGAYVPWQDILASEYNGQELVILFNSMGPRDWTHITKFWGHITA